MEESEYFDATACLEALKATRELDGNLKALQGLRKQLSSPQALSSLLQLIELSPTLPELANVWTAHASVKNQKILAELLSVYRACLEINAPSHSQASKTCSNNLKAFLTEPLLISHCDHDSKLKSSQSSIITDFQQSMASFVIKNKMKSLYQALGSDNRLLVNSALELMVSVAHHSPATASDLAAALDFSLPALSAVAKPPRPFHSKRDKASELDAQQVSMPCHGPAYWETWLSSKLSLRPSRSLFLDLGCSMLERCDHLTLSKLLSIRSFMSSMLLHLASDPPSSVVRILKILAIRVLLGPAAAGNKSTAIMTEGGLGATVRLGVFTDGVLLQLAESVVVFEDFAQQCVPDTAAQTSREEEEGGLSQDCVLAASASEELLGALLTDPHNGLAPKSSGHSPFLEAASLPGSGAKRILRLLPRLQPTSSPGHARLLQAVAELQPAMAAEFVSSLPYNMEPAATSKWVATAATVSGLLSRIASAPPSASSPQIHQILLNYRPSSVAVPRHPLINNDQAVAPHADNQSASAIIRLPLGSSLQACADPDTRFMFLPPPPPALDSQLMRSHLRRCLPPPLSKAVLSRGLQHPRQAVQLLTLQLLEGMLRCLVPLMELSYQAASQEQQLSLDLPNASFQPSELVVGSGDLHVDPHLSPSYKDSRARAEPAAADLSSSTCWRFFMNDLCSFVRVRVPDPHTLMALHASLEKQQKVAGQQMPDVHVSLNPDAGIPGDRLRTGAALEVGAPSKRAFHDPSVPEAKSTRKRADHKSEQVCPAGLVIVDAQNALLVQGLSGPAESGSAPQKKSHDRQPELSDVDDPDLPELEASLFGEDSSHLLLSAADGATSSKRGGSTTLDIAALVASGRIERIIMLLLKVLTLYRRFQSQAMDDAHFDSSKFVPEDVLSLPEPRQLALLDLIQADSASRGDGSPPGFSDKASGSYFYRSGLSVAPSLSTNSVINNALDSVMIMGSNRGTLPTGISASALLPLIRLTCLGSSGRVREVAADLAAARVREVTDMCCTSLASVIPAGSTAKALNPKNCNTAVNGSEHAGTLPANAPLITDPHRFDETLLFLGMLPRCSSSHALKAKHVVQKADNVSAACVVTTDGEDASGTHEGCQLKILQKQQEVQECEAVSNFLTNTVVQLMRRPHETYELVQEALHGALVMPAAGGGASHGNQLPLTSDATKRTAGGTTAGNKKARISGSSAQQVGTKQMGCSAQQGGTKQMGSRVVPTAHQQYLLRTSQSVGLLAVAALRSCLKVASSSRMPSHEKTAICAFTSSVIHGQLRVQRDCLPLMLMFRYILVAECSSQKQQAAQQRQEGTECFQDSKVSNDKDLSQAQATAAAAGSSSPPDEAGATLKLPFEAKCLWAVYQAGVLLVSELGRTSLYEASADFIRAAIESLKQLQAEVMSTDAASNDQLQGEAAGVVVSGLEQLEPPLSIRILAEKVLAALQGAALSSDAAVVPAAGSRLLMGHEHPSVKPGKKRRMSRGAPEETSRCAPEQNLQLQLFQLKQAMRTASATELRSSVLQLLVYCAAVVSSSGCPTLGIKGRVMPAAAAAAGGSLSLPGGNAMLAVQRTVTWKDRRLLAVEILHALCFSMMSKGLFIGDIMDDGDDDNGTMYQTLAEALMIASLSQAHAVDGQKDDKDVSSATLTKPLLAASHNTHRESLPMLLHLPSVLSLLGRLHSSPSVNACCEEVRHGLRSLGAAVAPNIIHIVLSEVLFSFTSPRQVSLKRSPDGEHSSPHNLSESDAPHVATVPVYTSWEHHLSTLKALLLPTSSSKAHIIHMKGTVTTLRTLFQDMDILYTEYLSHESPERVQHDVSCCTAAVHMLESLVATAGNSSTVSSTCPLHGTHLLGPSTIAADPSTTLQTQHESSGGLGFMSKLPPSPRFCLYCSAARRTVLHAVLPLVQAAGKVVLPLLDGAVAAINSDPVALSTLLGRKRPKQQLLPFGHSIKKGRRHGTLETVEKLAGPWTQYLNSMVLLAPHLNALDVIGLAQKVLIVARYIVTLKGQTLSTSTQNKLTTDSQLGYKQGKEIRHGGKLGKGGHKRDTPHAGGDDEGGRFIYESSLMLDTELDHFHQTAAVAMMLSAIAFQQQQDSNNGGGNGGAAGPEANAASLGARYKAASPHHKIEVKADMQHQQAGGGSTSCTAEVLLPSEDGSNIVSLAELLESCQEFLRLLIPVLHHSPSFVIRARDQLINSLMMIGSLDAVIDYSGHHSRSAMHLVMNPASSSSSSTLGGNLIASPSNRACLPNLPDIVGINRNLVLHKLGQEGRVQSQYQRQKDSGQRLASKLDWVLCVQAVISHPTRAGAEAVCQSVPATSSELGAAARMVIQALSLPTAASQQGPLSPESKDRKASKETGGSELENLVSTAAAAAAAERRRLNLAALLPLALKLLQNTKASADKALKWSQGSMKYNKGKSGTTDLCQGGLRYDGSPACAEIPKWAAELSSLYQAPLIAYAKRKRKKTANTGLINQGSRQQQRQPPQEPVLTRHNYGAGLVSHDDTINDNKKMGDDDVSSALRSYAVPVLLQCLEVNPQGLEEGERRRLVEGLLPEGGLSLEDVRGQPAADSVQQLALGVSLIMKAVADEKLKEVQCVPNAQQGSDPQACCKGDIKHGGEQGSSSEAASGAVMGTLLPLLICCCSTLSRLCTERDLWSWPKAQQQCRSTLSAAVSRDAVRVEAIGQTLGMRGCIWRHEGLSMALINYLDGPVGDLVSELKDADRTGDAFTAACRAAATLGASVLQYAGGTAVLVRCVRRLVAALLPAGSEDVAESEGEIKEEEEEVEEEEEEEVALDVDVNGQDDVMDSEDMLSDDVDSQHDGDEEFPVDKEGLEEVVQDSEEVFEDSEAKSIDSLDNDGMVGEVSGMEGSEMSEEEDQMEVEGINEESGDEDEGLNNTDEEEAKDPVNSGDAPPAGRASPKMQQQRLLHEEPVQDFSVELSQPALPDIPHIPNPAVAACSSWLLQHLIKYSPLFNSHPTDQLSSLTSQPTTNTADSSHAVDGPAGPSHTEEPSMSHHGTATFAAPLPACVAQLATPIHSALDAISTSASSHGISAPPSATASSKGRLPNEVIHGSQLGWLDCTADSLNLELLLLLESLIDTRRAFDSPDCKTTLEVPESGGTTGSWPEPGTTDAASLEALLRLLQCCYGASLSPEDRACLRIMFTLDVLLQHGSSGHSLLSSRLSGPLARSGYLWGQAAKQYYRQMHSDKGKGSGIKVSAKLQSSKRLNADSDLQPNDGLNTAAFPVRVLKEECPPEVRRAVLTTVWFPSGRTASGDDEEEGAGIAEDADPLGKSIKSTWLWPEDVRAAAFDPAYLLLFSLSCLGGVNPSSVATRHQGLQRTASGIAREREHILDVNSFVHWGLLALCLRCLAAKDVLIRALAYECLSLFTQLLESSDGTASAASHPQLQALLSHVRQGVPYPLARLSSSSCLLASEASFTLSSPTAPAYALVNRAILRKEAMGSSDAINLALRLMGGGTPQYRMEQSWAARLLYAGILDGQDADLYRRKYIVEIVSSIHDGPSVETVASSDSNEVAIMLLGTLLSASAVPSFAKYLVLQTGAVPWLCNKIVEALSSNDRMLWLTTQIAKNSPHAIAAQSSTKSLSLQLCVNILHALVARFVEVEEAQEHQADMKESGHALCKHDSAERLPERRTRGAPLCISLAELQLKPFVCELLGAGITLINTKGRHAGCKGLEASDSSKRLMHLLIFLRNQLDLRQ
ncbi:hypothetical protein CEUSTIGMA_g4846.t1 [Chlamydomonas eustigma]|uniref:Uncharacterized protein n=1 Tax=Chlamydomonas eustigma TaxID=1157962 RepID=A0A250X3Q2_9CHLO|nr:hypothetical protein CEUSTIGMA_g4846.t1 [Chlamydomonas eustigma]|eukprot:GAX77400.1 hypothetical protein CEUSTIGMA_g4846.t1 [Chlamydomonas eustigma]